LTDDQKSLLKFFAYRFIKIDFENVANYYSFNASEEEQKAIERLRLVLTDNGVKGFIEDDLLKIMGFTDQEFKAI
jgi:spore germination protein YaaH